MWNPARAATRRKYCRRAARQFLQIASPATGAREFLPLMQPLEHAKNSFKILRVDSQSVVLHREYPFLPAIPGGGDVHAGDPRILVLDRIADKVLK